MNNEKRIQAAFGAVRAEDGLKRGAMRYIEEKTGSFGATVPRTVRRPRTAFVFVCILAVLLLAGCGAYYTPSAAISVDVNPSLELSINVFDRVIALKAFNEDGKALMDTLDVANMSYTKALEALMSSEVIASYIARGETVTVTVLGADGERGERMLERVSACMGAQGDGVYCCAGNRKNSQAAHDAGLSAGKYNAYLELASLDPTVTLDYVRSLSMREIRELISAISGGDASCAGGGRGGCGRGHGAGAGE